MALADYLTNMNNSNQASGNPLTDGIKALGNQGDNSGDPTAPVFKTPDKFSYDAASDPQYQSALSLAKQNIQTEQGNTLANLVSHGQGNSSYSAGAVAQVADRSMGNLNNNLLPQFIKEAYNHYQDTIKNNYQTQLANYNAGQDKIKNNQWDQTFGAGRTDAANNLAINKGTLTGNYTDPGMLALQKQMQDNSAKWQANPNNDPTIAAQNDALHNSNINLAKQLGETYDPNTGKYTGGGPTIRTIAGQTLDLNNAKEMATLTGYMSDGKGGYIPTNAKQQQELTDAWTATNNLGSVTSALSKLTGIAVGTPTQAAKNQAAQIAVSQQSANASTKNADTAAANGLATRDNLTTDNKRQQTEFDQKQKDANYQKSFNNLKSLYTAKDPYTGEIKTTNPQALRSAILAKNLSDDETIQLLSDFGLPIKQ